MRCRRAIGIYLLCAVLGAACVGAPARGDRSGPSEPARSASTPSKRITAAVTGNLTTLASQLNSAAGGSLPGSAEVEELVHAGLAVADDRNQLRPQLAEQIPKIENGLWKVFPDGRMETTWSIRQGARWHDGIAFTAEDLVFTGLVAQDKELTTFRHIAYNAIERIEAPDPRHEWDVR